MCAQAYLQPHPVQAPRRHRPTGHHYVVTTQAIGACQAALSGQQQCTLPQKAAMLVSCRCVAAAPVAAQRRPSRAPEQGWATLRPGPLLGTGVRASASKAARLEPCRCVALMRSSADSSAATSAQASVGRSSGGGGPSSGGRKSALRCSAASVRSAWRTRAFS